MNGAKVPSFHWVSHRISSDGSEGQAIPDAVELHHQIDRLQMGFYKHLLDRLNGYSSPNGGTLLDDCAAVWTNDLGSGPSHDASNTPWIVAGSGGGTLRTGQVIDHLKNPVNQMLNTLINGMGIRLSSGAPTDDFGDATLAKGVVANSLV